MRNIQEQPGGSSQPIDEETTTNADAGRAAPNSAAGTSTIGVGAATGSGGVGTGGSGGTTGSQQGTRGVGATGGGGDAVVANSLTGDRGSGVSTGGEADLPDDIRRWLRVPYMVERDQPDG